MDNKISNYIQELEHTFDLKFVGKVHSYEKGGDIDFNVRTEQREKITNFLLQKGFVMRNVSAHGVSGCIFLNGELYVLDFTDTSEVILTLYPDVHFKPVFYADIWDDSELERFMRYSLQLRRHKLRYIEFVRENFYKYGRYLSDTTYLTKPVFKKNTTVGQLTAAMKREPLAFLKVYSIPRLIQMCTTLFRIHFNQIGKGEIVAFVGADGAGKSTAIESVWKVMGAHKVYMGDVNFRLHRVHKFLFKQPVFIARLSYPLMYIENWFRYAWIWSRKIKGDIVYTDRWPGLNQHLRSDEGKMKIHDWLYTFFPNPNRYIFLSGEPAAIHARKPELTIGEIEILQKNLRKRLAGKEYLEVANEDLDTALTLVLDYLMQTKWRKIN